MICDSRSRDGRGRGDNTRSDLSESCHVHMHHASLVPMQSDPDADLQLINNVVLEYHNSANLSTLVDYPCNSEAKSSVFLASP